MQRIIQHIGRQVVIFTVKWSYVKEKAGMQMIISTNALVSNSEIIKNYKACREKAEIFGKIFVLKNNQPDAVLFSVKEYERLSVFIEYLESLEETEVAQFIDSLPKEGNRKRYSIDRLHDLANRVKTDSVDV